MKEEASQPPFFVQLGCLLWRDRAVGVANSCSLSQFCCTYTYLSSFGGLSVTSFHSIIMYSVDCKVAMSHITNINEVGRSVGSVSWFVT